MIPRVAWFGVPAAAAWLVGCSRTDIDTTPTPTIPTVSSPPDSGEPADVGGCQVGLHTLASGTSSCNVPQEGLAIGDQNVYWTPYDEYGYQSIVAVPKCGGVAVTLVPRIEAPGTSFAVDSRNVYWLTPDGVVAKAPLAGGTPETLVATIMVGSAGPVVDDTSVYWASGTLLLGVPIAGGDVFTVAANPTVDLDAGPYLVAPQCNLLIHDGKFYMTADINLDGEGGCPAGVVVSMPVQGGPVTLLTADAVYPCGIAVDDTDLYWADTTGVGRVSLSGENATNFDHCGASSVALDSTHVFWAAGAEVKAAPKSALEKQEVLFIGSFVSISSIAVDTTAVYSAADEFLWRYAPLTR